MCPSSSTSRPKKLKIGENFKHTITTTINLLPTITTIKKK